MSASCTENISLSALLWLVVSVYQEGYISLSYQLAPLSHVIIKISIHAVSLSGLFICWLTIRCSLTFILISICLRYIYKSRNTFSSILFFSDNFNFCISITLTQIIRSALFYETKITTNEYTMIQPWHKTQVILITKQTDIIK